MAKLLVFLCVVLLAITLVLSQGNDECKQPGMMCAKHEECCTGFWCHPWAKRCTKRPPGPLLDKLGLDFGLHWGNDENVEAE